VRKKEKQKTWRLYKNPKFVETPRKHHAKSESNKKGRERERKERKMLKNKIKQKTALIIPRKWLRQDHRDRRVNIELSSSLTVKLGYCHSPTLRAASYR
jgi:hypothetical protein